MARRKMNTDGESSLAGRIGNTMSSTVDPDTRNLFLVGGIDEGAAYRFITAFRTLDSTKGPILITLCTPGGSVEHGFAIYDTIRAANNVVAIEGTGQVASMGVGILQAAPIRLLTPNCNVMIHQGGMDFGRGASFRTDDLISTATDLKKSLNRYYSILADRAKKTIEDIAKICVNDTFLSAEEAVGLGLADKVVPFPKLPDVDWTATVEEPKKVAKKPVKKKA